MGTPVPVPSAKRREELVLMRVEGTEPHGLELLRTLLVRPKRRLIALDEAAFRLVPGTASDGLLLRIPRASDYPGALAMAPNPSYVTIGREGGEPGGKLHFTFEEVPIRPFPTR